MNEIFLNSTTIGVVLSIIAYEIGTYLKKKTKLAICNPMLIAIIIIISVLITSILVSTIKLCMIGTVAVQMVLWIFMILQMLQLEATGPIQIHIR